MDEPDANVANQMAQPAREVKDAAPSLRYAVISVGHLDQLHKRIAITARCYPEAGIVGGAAMRAWCELRGVPIPEEFGADMDIVQPDLQAYYADQTTEAGWIDVFPADVPIAEPLFTTVKYDGRRVTLASLPYLLVRKMLFIHEGIEERDNIMQKDTVYLELLESLVAPDEFNACIHALQGLGQLSDWADYHTEVARANAEIARLQREHKIHDAVHPENAVNP